MDSFEAVESHVNVREDNFVKIILNEAPPTPFDEQMRLLNTYYDCKLDEVIQLITKRIKTKR